MALAAPGIKQLSGILCCQVAHRHYLHLLQLRDLSKQQQVLNRRAFPFFHFARLFLDALF
jgi:hypothetical protein